MCCRSGYRGELCSLYEALVQRPWLWDKNLVLNSDGRRLLESLLRMLLREHPEHRRLAREARRDPTWDNIARLASLSFYRCPVEDSPPWLRLPTRWRSLAPWG